MKYDYQVINNIGYTVSCLTLAEAKKAARAMLKTHPNCKPIIDQAYKDDEWTGVWWTLEGNKFVKH